MATSTITPLSTITSVPTEADTMTNFTFNVIDYIVFTVMLAISAGIGVYFGFFSKSKNTTDEYLMGGKKMKTLPIAISLIASQLSGIAIMSIPAEGYSFGVTYVFFVVSIIFVIPVLCHVIVPVFYENNISNCYEYLEIRFNKLARQIVTVTFVLNAFLALPVYMFLPSLAFAQVTNINVHLINSVVCFICVFYTMLGGIKAVVWTDVVQAAIMLTSVVMVGIMGVVKIGGLGKVLENATLGGRMEINFDLDPRVRTTFWSAMLSGFCMWAGHIGLNQSCVQRIVSLPSIDHAKRSLTIAGIGIIIIMSFNSFIGIVMFARYYGCDPIAAKLVAKADKLMPFFVQDIMGHLHGMPGIFISCVFSAALSTLSAWLNSLSGIVYFDYCKPFVKHTDAKANFIMKTIVIVMGIYCVLGGFAVEKFSSILQTMITIAGIFTGAVAGAFLLGMFVPRVNGKVAVISILASIFLMIWIIVNAQIRLKNGVIQYDPLPSSIDQCAARNVTILVDAIKSTPTTLFGLNVTEAAISTTTEIPLITNAFSSNRPFSIFEISFFWYKVIGIAVVFIVAIPLSYIMKREDDEKIDPKLYTPLIRRFLKVQSIELEEVPLKTPMENNFINSDKIIFTEKSDFKEKDNV